MRIKMMLLVLRYIKQKTKTGKTSEYKTKLIGSTLNNNNILDREVVVPLKYLSNFRRSLDLLLIDCYIEIDLSWSKECIVSEISVRLVIAGNPPTPEK